MAVLMLSSVTACAGNAAAETDTEELSSETAAHSDVLVAYFSATGTTKGVAEKIASESVGIDCQGCGAKLAIRKGSISFCAYCGSAIRVTAEGKASVLSPEARKAVIDRARAEHKKNNQ